MTNKDNFSPSEFKSIFEEDAFPVVKIKTSFGTSVTVREEFWKTREGELIAVGDLDVSHMRNILRMILKARRERKQEHVFSYLLDEANDRN